MVTYGLCGWPVGKYFLVQYWVSEFTGLDYWTGPLDWTTGLINLGLFNEYKGS